MDGACDLIYTFEPAVKDHPKCKGEVVVHKNRTTVGLFREEVQTHRLRGR